MEPEGGRGELRDTKECLGLRRNTMPNPGLVEEKHRVSNRTTGGMTQNMKTALYGTVEKLPKITRQTAFAFPLYERKGKIISDVRGPMVLVSVELCNAIL